MADGVFKHGVSSGDPLTDAVVIWTRVSAGELPVPFSWKLARDQALREIVAEGEAEATPEADFTVKGRRRGPRPGRHLLLGEPLHDALLKLKLIDEDGVGPDEDQWDGYPAERRELIERFGGVEDLLVLSADIHVSVAAEITLENGDPVAPEVTSPSLTSRNLDEKLGVEQRAEIVQQSERAFVEALDHVHWCEMASHGYVLVDVDRERVRAEWWHVDGVLERLPGERCAAAFELRRGERVLTEAQPGSAIRPQRAGARRRLARPRKRARRGSPRAARAARDL
jgi:phosphodiesterase/alkaline phosphatase D-like protein